MEDSCHYRGVWKKEFNTQIYGCRYFNDLRAISFREQCPYKDVDVRKCEKFKEPKENDD